MSALKVGLWCPDCGYLEDDAVVDGRCMACGCPGRDHVPATVVPTAALEVVREWAHTTHGGAKMPIEIWPGLAALLDKPAPESEPQ